MAGRSQICILAPGVIQESPLPRGFRARGSFTGLAGLEADALRARVLGLDPARLAPAALHYLALTGREPAGYCLFAYPVHLHARRQQLILMSGPEFDASESESESLIETLRAYYPQWRFETTGDGMWFLIVDDAPELLATPLERVVGEDINQHLPGGADTMGWLKTLNEIQMILFDSPVNKQREAAGQPPLNSLWLWGGGRLPAARQSPWRRVVTDDPVTLGAARRAGIQARWLEPRGGAKGLDDAELEEPDTLVVSVRGAGDDEGAPLLSPRQWRLARRALGRRRIESLRLVEPGCGELLIDARGARGPWPWR